jgi:hypothetical protein
MLKIDGDQILAYLRIQEEAIMLVVLNYGGQTQKFKTSFNKGKILIDTNLEKLDLPVDLSVITLKPHKRRGLGTNTRANPRAPWRY